MYAFAFEELLRCHRALDFAGEEDGVVRGSAGVENIFRVGVGIEDQDVPEGDCAGHLEVDGGETDLALHLAGIALDDLFHQACLHLRGLHGDCYRCQQQHYESEDSGGYVVTPFRMRTIILIYKNKK